MINLKDGLKGIGHKVQQGDDAIGIAGVCHDSRQVSPGYVFVCIKGHETDGHRFVEDALRRGCVALIVQDDLFCVPSHICVVKTADTRAALAVLSMNFYGNAAKNMKIVGITGTKGKTTVTYMLQSIFEKAHVRYGLIGTIAKIINGSVVRTARTTPEADELHADFRAMVDQGTEYVAMEVSSQGIMLKRVYKIPFAVGIFHNISQAHIGPKEHASFDEYVDYKSELLTMCKTGLVNLDDPHAHVVMERATCPVLTYGIEKKADLMASKIKKSFDSIEFDLMTPWFCGPIKVSMPGLYNVYNALAAVGAVGVLGFDLSTVQQGLEHVVVKGRTEMVPVPIKGNVMIDYAHSPDSLEKLLVELKQSVKGRLICLFGCGGDRDRSMRPMMGSIAGRHADFSIITSDNPRTEDPERILSDIEKGMKNSNGLYVRITDRTQAIKFGLDHIKQNDLLVLAGKGHEDYLEINGEKLHYDEREVIRSILKLNVD